MKKRNDSAVVHYTGDVSLNHKLIEGREGEKITNFQIHEFFEVVLIISENVVWTIGNKTYYPKPNSLILINSMDLHEVYLSKPGIYEHYVMMLRPSYIESISFGGINLLECFLFRPFDDAHYIPLDDEQGEKIRSLFDSFILKTTVEGGNLWYELLHRFLLGEIFVHLNTLYREYHNITPENIKNDYSTIYSIMEYIHAHLNEPLSLDILAKKEYLNKSYLCTLFKKVTGATPNQYINNCRLMKAKELLMRNIPVTTVCEKVGFNDLSAFSRTFKKQIGCSPKQYAINNPFKN